MQSVKHLQLLLALQYAVQQRKGKHSTSSNKHSRDVKGMIVTLPQEYCGHHAVFWKALLPLIPKKDEDSRDLAAVHCLNLEFM